MRISAASALLLAAVCSGCVTGPGGQAEGGGLRQYLVDRGNDFADIFEFRIAGGHGLLGSVKAAPGVRLALGYIDAEKIGVTGRYVGAWKERGSEFALPFNYAFRNYLVEPLYGNDYFNELMAKLPKIQPDRPGEDRGPSLQGLFDGPGFEYEFIRAGHDPREFGIGDFPRPYSADIEVKLHPFFMGLDFGLSLQEMWDFLTGVFGLDFGKDDLKSRVAIKKARAEANRE